LFYGPSVRVQNRLWAFKTLFHGFRREKLGIDRALPLEYLIYTVLADLNAYLVINLQVVKDMIIVLDIFFAKFASHNLRIEIKNKKIT